MYLEADRKRTTTEERKKSSPKAFRKPRHHQTEVRINKKVQKQAPLTQHNRKRHTIGIQEDQNSHNQNHDVTIRDMTSE